MQATGSADGGVGGHIPKGLISRRRANWQRLPVAAMRVAKFRGQLRCQAARGACQSESSLLLSLNARDTQSSQARDSTTRGHFQHAMRASVGKDAHMVLKNVQKTRVAGRELHGWRAASWLSCVWLWDSLLASSGQRIARARYSSRVCSWCVVTQCQIHRTTGPGSLQHFLTSTAISAMSRVIGLDCATCTMKRMSLGSMVPHALKNIRKMAHTPLFRQIPTGRWHWASAAPSQYPCTAFGMK